VNYDRDGEALVHDHTVGEGVFRIRAEAIHQERTGVHARLAILYQGVALSWSTFNIERDEDRVRLANSAHKHLNGQAKDYPVAYLKQDLDDFCYGLWDATLGDLAPRLMEGSLAPRPTSFVLRPYIVEGGGTIIFAHPGRGKSYTTLLMAVSIDAGVQTLWPVQQGRVLWINLERGQRGVEDRLGNVNAALGLPRNRPLLTLNARGRSLADVLPAARKAVREQHIGVVLLDSISRAGLGDLTENNPVNKIMDAMNGLAESWFGVAHAPRASDEHLYGSIHFEAGADVVVRLLSQQEDGGPLGVGLEITKENDVGKQPQHILALEFGEYGLAGVRRARLGEFPDVETGKKMTLRDEVRTYLLDVGKASATAISDALDRNRSNVAALLSHDPSFVALEKQGRDQLYAVMATGAR
jgi:hypothetical protein